MENLLSKEEMEAIINGDHSNPFAVLGIHKDKGSKEVFIRAYQPNSRSMELLDSNGASLGQMTKLTSVRVKILLIVFGLKMIAETFMKKKILTDSPPSWEI